MNNELLLAVGFVVGGMGAGPLQVLWGDRFARHPTIFAAFASPAAAIVTALVAGMSSDHTSFIGFAVIPCCRSGCYCSRRTARACRGASCRASGRKLRKARRPRRRARMMRDAQPKRTSPA